MGWIVFRLWVGLLGLSASASPIAEAICAESAEQLTAALQAGNDPNLAVAGSEAPILLAAVRGRAELVQLLQRAGARPDAYWTGQGHAGELGPTYPHLRLQPILQSIKPYAMVVAAALGHVEVLRLYRNEYTRPRLGKPLPLLGARSADNDLSNLEDCLRVAIVEDRVTVVAELLPHLRARRLAYFLRFLTRFDSPQTLRWALAQRASLVSETDECGYTYLHDAAASGQAGQVRILLEAGADVDALSVSGRTALSLAALREPPPSGCARKILQFRNNRTLECLMEYQAIVVHEDRFKQGPLDYGIHGRELLILQLIRSDRLIDLKTILQRRPAYLREVDHFGCSWLHHAVQENKAAAVQLLLDLGVQVDASSRIQGTALHIAALQRQREIVLRLLNAGADPHLPDASGRSALEQWPEIKTLYRNVPRP